MTTRLDRIYRHIRDLTNIDRERDPRLELVAHDRALELRRELGLTSEPGEKIVHDPTQLAARVVPHLAAGLTSEIATWHYYPPSWVDPVNAAVDAELSDGPDAGTRVGWWNSEDHRHVLENANYDAMGVGLYFETPPDAAPRWYFVAVLAFEMKPMTIRDAILQPGKYVGRQFMADGRISGSANREVTEPTTVKVDYRLEIPGKGPHLRVSAGGGLRNFWVPESAQAQLAQLV